MCRHPPRKANTKKGNAYFIPSTPLSISCQDLIHTRHTEERHSKWGECDWNTKAPVQVRGGKAHEASQSFSLKDLECTVSCIKPCGLTWSAAWLYYRTDWGFGPVYFSILSHQSRVPRSSLMAGRENNYCIAWFIGAFGLLDTRRPQV